MALAERHAEVVWNGNLTQGNGTITAGSGALRQLPVTFAARTENPDGKTSPEELIAAAHAGCFSMALSAGLTKAGHPPTRVHTTARVHLEKVGEGFGITRIELTTEAQVPGIDNKAFQEQAEGAKKGCPVSKVLAGAQISLTATLKS